MFKLFIHFSIIIAVLIVHSHAKAEQKNKTPSIKWKTSTGGPIYGSADIIENKIVFASSDGKVYALDKLTGAILWTQKTDGAIYSDVNIKNKHAYLQSDDGYVYKISAQDGRITWKSKIVNTEMTKRKAHFGPNGWDHKSSTPTKKGEFVYVGSTDKYLYALDDNTGGVAWRFQAQSKIRSTPAIAKGLIIFGCHDGYIYALKQSNGRLAWTFDTLSVPARRRAINSTPKIFNKVIYIGARNQNLYALDLETGQKIWQYFYGKSWVESDAEVFGNTLYIGSSFLRSQLAINIETGKPKWINHSVNGLSFSKPTITNEALYTGIAGVKKINNKDKDFLEGAGILKLDRITGKEIWRLPLKDYMQNLNERGVTGNIHIDNRSLYFGSLDGNFYAASDTE